MYKFIDKHGYGKPYIYIHPYKQYIVKKIVDDIPDWVEFLILFGSSVLPTCKPTSDLDLCIIGTPPNKRNYIIDTEDHEVDILQYDSKDDFLNSLKRNPYGAVSDIYKKGVVIYAR